MQRAVAPPPWVIVCCSRGRFRLSIFPLPRHGPPLRCSEEPNRSCSRRFSQANQVSDPSIRMSTLVSRRLSNQGSSSPAPCGRSSLLHSLPMPPRVAGILSASPMARPAPPSLRGPSPPWRLASVSQAKAPVGMQLSPPPAAGPAALRLLSGSRAARLSVCVCVVERECAGRGVRGAGVRVSGKV